MKKNKFIKFIKKENIYENYILLALSIVGMLISVLGLFNVITFENFKNEKAFLIILLIVSIISLILSIAKLEKIYKTKNSVKPKIMITLEDACTNKNTNFFDVIKENGYSIYTEEDDNGLLLTKYDITFCLYKDELQYIIEVNNKQMVVDIDLNEDLLVNVKDEYHEVIFEVDTVIEKINEQTTIYDLLNVLDNITSENKQYFLGLYNKYKK